MAEFNRGDKVTWIAEMQCVPHPDGKTDRKGEPLPVFRDKQMTGTIVNSCYDGDDDFVAKLHRCRTIFPLHKLVISVRASSPLEKHGTEARRLI